MFYNIFYSKITYFPQDESSMKFTNIALTDRLSGPGLLTSMMAASTFRSIKRPK